jgi:hypothetical protein
MELVDGMNRELMMAVMSKSDPSSIATINRLLDSVIPYKLAGPLADDSKVFGLKAKIATIVRANSDGASIGLIRAAVAEAVDDLRAQDANVQYGPSKMSATSLGSASILALISLVVSS